MNKENNCYFNIEGKCTYPKSYSKYIGNSGRDWNSRENCTFSQYGAQKICSCYKLED